MTVGCWRNVARATTRHIPAFLYLLLRGNILYVVTLSSLIVYAANTLTPHLKPPRREKINKRNSTLFARTARAHRRISGIQNRLYLDLTLFTRLPAVSRGWRTQHAYENFSVHLDK